MPRIIKPAVGSFTASNITVDSSGRIVAASSGAGAANMVKTFARGTAETATFTAQPTTTKLHLYMSGGGGGGGGGVPAGTGRDGGFGGFGFFNVPVSQPFSVPYTIGAGGAGGTNTGTGNVGSAGQASSFNTNLVANGGAGGLKHNSNPDVGASGTLQNHTIAYINGDDMQQISAGHYFHEAKLVQEEGNPSTNAISNMVMAQGTQTSGSLPAFLGSTKIAVSGQGGRAGHGSQFPAPFSGLEGRDGGVVIYEDIG